MCLIEGPHASCLVAVLRASLSIGIGICKVLKEIRYKDKKGCLCPKSNSSLLLVYVQEMFLKHTSRTKLLKSNNFRNWTLIIFQLLSNSN